MKIEEMKLIELEGYRFRINHYEVEVRKLEHDAGEKDHEIRSLRIQKD